MTQTIYVVIIHRDDDDLHIKYFKTKENAKKYLYSIFVEDIQNDLEEFGYSCDINLPVSMLEKNGV